ncbi:uncharacterized protein FFB20_08742 [Fusarium fujikuroi]|uniref:chitin synthase n=1 Tax=Fusarium fujikuroi TaxID=5127 RepID=A0A2H3R7B7_FUSFU|nr:uncharacterized protein Y057_335 [Fusarium fujikuroi]SCN66241.1 uncharacterized protein FFE2_00360 [Fusarium fujikuroi]SCN69188.1 uncharacterized protein FFC1_00355 [Fusarium fujikuroi]SCN90550.1 uncharacterized protein FFB20_08742 [Fusarium fujikuroi]SCO28486.1 uncharacterized protein FFNC_00360 [Fusarium fujikuroi]
MDPLSIISGCAGLITAIGSLSTSINTFVRSCREARSDLDRVSRELHSLQTVLELIEEDAKDDTKPFPLTIQHHVSGIVTNCGSVVLEVETCIKKYGDGRIKSKAAWAINGQGDMEKLRSSLEAHKSALELALDMISLSLTKDIKTDTTEIRNDTAAIKDDTALILQEIAQLQARLPDTAAAPNDYILQRFLEDMATYTETALDAEVDLCDRTSCRSLPIPDEHSQNSPVHVQDHLPIVAAEDPGTYEASLLAFRKKVQHLSSPRPHNYGRVQPSRPEKDVPQRPKGPGPVSSYSEVFYKKEVAPANDPRVSRSSALASSSRNEEMQHQITPSPVGIHQDDSHKQSTLSDFALLDDFDPLWRERYGEYLHDKAFSNDAVRENQEFVISLLKEVKAEMPYYPQQNYPPPPIAYVRAESDQGQPLPSMRAPQHTNPLNAASLGSPQQLMPYIVPTDGPIPREEEDTVTSLPRAKYLSRQGEYHIQRFRGNVVFDLPVPDWILTCHSTPPDRNESTHRRISFITCPPEEFADQNYTLRPELFARPRQTQFILVIQVDPDDTDFILRWNLIHDSIAYAQQQSHGFWKRVIVHLHLAYGTTWGARSSDHPLDVLESIGAKQIMNTRIARIDSQPFGEPIGEDTSAISGHRVHAIMSEYTVQLCPLEDPPSTVATTEVPIQVVITTARVPEGLCHYWRDRYIPWTCAINKVLKAEHVIDMNVISHNSMLKNDVLWEILRMDRHIPFVKDKPFPGTDLEVLRFDSLIGEMRANENGGPWAIEKKPRKRWARWLK